MAAAMPFHDGSHMSEPLVATILRKARCQRVTHTRGLLNAKTARQLA